MVQGQQGQQYFSTTPQQFRPVGQVMPSGGPDLRPHFSHSMQQLPQRAGQPLHTHPMHYVQANMPLPSGSPQPQQGAAGVNIVSSYRVRYQNMLTVVLFVNIYVSSLILLWSIQLYW